MTHEVIESPEDKEWERIASRAQARDLESCARQRFSEVTGLCRTCKNALIRRRAYSEVPTVICEKLWEQPHQVPLDIMQCTGYERVGEMTLRDMHEMATLINLSKPTGQYL